ncbi:MAG: hypothetical protein H6742_07720 [Alphaproteobacteria bacterium]|nr:hypothetical protein [Alphaproteobacteria bacterium]
MKSSILPLVLLLGAGCTNEDIWLIQVPFVPEPDCETNITHNFVGASIPQTTPGEWTEETYTEQSDALYFAQISFLNGNTAVMVIGGEVWPGVSTGKGEWEFSWEGEQDDRLSREHDAGYRYTQQDYSKVTEVISMAVDGKTAEGTWEVTAVADTTWTESDTWDLEVGLASGSIPSASYLEDTDGFGQVNLQDDTDCQASPCTLRVQETCSEDKDFTATYTGYSSEEAYDQLEGASQPHGAN